MNTPETSRDKLVVRDLWMADAIFRAGRYSIGGWLSENDAVALQRPIDIANRTKQWIVNARRRIDVPPLVFLDEDKALVMGNLWAAQADTTNAYRAEAQEVLEQYYGGSVTFMSQVAVTKAIPTQRAATAPEFTADAG